MRKQMLRGVSEVTATLGKANSHFDPTQTGDRTTTLRRLLIGQMVLFLFFLAKAALAYLPTTLFVALRSLFPFWQAQFVQVFLLKPAPLYELFAGLCSTNKSSISFPFSSSDSCDPVLSSVFPFTSVSLADLS